MAVKFTKELEQYTTTQKAARVKHFTEFTSKKHLEESDALTGEKLAFALSIKGTFNFALHEGERYMAVTLYKGSAERKYNFLILDLEEQAIAEANSIREAKASILELVEEEMANTAKDILEEVLAEQEAQSAGAEEESAEE